MLASLTREELERAALALFDEASLAAFVAEARRWPELPLRTTLAACIPQLCVVEAAVRWARQEAPRAR